MRLRTLMRTYRSGVSIYANNSTYGGQEKPPPAQLILECQFRDKGRRIFKRADESEIEIFFRKNGLSERLYVFCRNAAVFLFDLFRAFYRLAHHFLPAVKVRPGVARFELKLHIAENIFLRL